MARLSESLARTGIVMSPIGAKGRYSVARRVGDLVYVSGQGSQIDGELLTGCVGRDVQLLEAQRGARGMALSLLSAAASVAPIDTIIGVVATTVFVRADGDFVDHIAVADGCTGLFEELFGVAGLPTRAAVGVSSLPFGLAVEATAVFQVQDDGAAQ